MTSFIAEIFHRLLPQIGATATLEPEFGNVGYVTFASGKRTFFRDNRFDLNPLGSVKLVQDKAHTAYFLSHFGYRVPRQLTFWALGKFPSTPQPRSIDTAIEFAREVGFPVFLKPNDRSQGLGVAKCYDEMELRAAADEALKISSVAMVQELAVGRDWRVVILDGDVISAYQRVPLSVTGDGHSAVRQLLMDLQQRFRTAGRETTIRTTDPRLQKNLRRLGLTLDSILVADQSVRLHDISNLSVGGHCVDVTSQLHPSVASLCRDVARELRLRICGVDLICADITQPLTDYRIIELNSAPGLDNYAHQNQDDQQHLVDDLYLRLLRAVERGPDNWAP